MTFPILNSTDLKVAAFPSRRPGAARLSATVVVKGTFALVRGGRATPVAASKQLELTGDLAFDDPIGKSCRYPSDFAPFKARMDVMVVGTCFAPRGEVTTAHAAFSFGTVRKELAVIGDRRWVPATLGGHVQSEPRPFRSMPLRYELAFGGSGFRDNPIGKGFAEGTVPPSLPNLENPGRLVRTPADRPAPAGFGPIDRALPSRAARAGTYDAKWLAERWPWVADDCDGSYFNAAPEDQQIAAALTGEETFAFDGMHPDGARFEAKLPALRPACFVRRTPAAGGRLEEVSLRLDTVWVDTDAGLLVLAWRGLTATASRGLEDLAEIALTADEPGRPAGKVSVSIAVPHEPPREEVLAAQEEEAARATTVAAPVNEETELSEAREILRAANPKLLERVEGAKTVEELLAALALDAPAPVADGTLERLDRAALARAQSLLAEAGADKSFFEPEPPAAPSAPSVSPRLTREDVAARVAARQGFSRADLSGVDLSGLDLHGAELDHAVLEGANLSGANLAEAKLAGANLARAKLVGAELRKACLDGADLASADLEGADLAGTSLVRTSFDGAVLRGASLRGGRGERAVFRGADLKGADLGEAEFLRASFAGCRLDGARFDKARLTNASFEGATGVEVSMAGADLTRARAAGSSFAGGRFDGARAEGSIWTGARLAGAHFDRASLDRADFSEADASAASFDHAVLRQASLVRAKLAGAKLTKANLFRADLEGADLRAADCRASNLFECELWEADVSQARFDGSNLKRTKLAGAVKS